MTQHSTHKHWIHVPPMHHSDQINIAMMHLLSRKVKDNRKRITTLRVTGPIVIKLDTEQPKQIG